MTGVNFDVSVSVELFMVILQNVSGSSHCLIAFVKCCL
jgi:hypothetical protein